jgi:hypothetical protein
MTRADTRTAIEAELGCELSEITRADAQIHHNIHYRGTLPDGSSVS